MIPWSPSKTVICEHLAVFNAFHPYNSPLKQGSCLISLNTNREWGRKGKKGRRPLRPRGSRAQVSQPQGTHSYWTAAHPGCTCSVMVTSAPSQIHTRVLCWSERNSQDTAKTRLHVNKAMAAKSQQTNKVQKSSEVPKFTLWLLCFSDLNSLKGETENDPLLYRASSKPAVYFAWAPEEFQKKH